MDWIRGVRMRRLNEEELSKALADLSGWTGDTAGIERWYSWPSFNAAIAFVNKVATVAETANHHPDVDVRFNRVRVFLSTHDAGGVTTRDVELAYAIERVIAS